MEEQMCNSTYEGLKTTSLSLVNKAKQHLLQNSFVKSKLLNITPLDPGLKSISQFCKSSIENTF